MLWAVKNNSRVTAEPYERATCPGCDQEVLAKCGEIKIWHWAHKVNDCDPWHEPESDWHLEWKSRFPPAWQEVIIGRHRADVKTPKRVVELQSSSISSQDIREREIFYGQMLWIVRGEEFFDNLNLWNHGAYVSFRWRHPRKSWWYAQKPLFIDSGTGDLFHVKKIHAECPCGGWGKWVEKEALLRWLKKEAWL